MTFGSTRQLFSILVPLVATFGGPYLSTFLHRWPPSLKYLLSALIGITVGILGSEYTNYPMHADAASAQNLTSSLLGQKLLEMRSEELK